jgi:hypothetical protein
MMLDFRNFDSDSVISNLLTNSSNYTIYYDALRIFFLKLFKYNNKIL